MKIKVEPIKVNYYPEVCELCGGKVIITSKEDISGKCYCCVNCGAYAKTYMEEPDNSSSKKETVLAPIKVVEQSLFLCFTVRKQALLYRQASQ